jgi:hypothetical protein
VLLWGCVVQVAYKAVEDLAAVWCEWAEMEIRAHHFQQALALCRRATQQPAETLGRQADSEWHAASHGPLSRTSPSAGALAHFQKHTFCIATCSCGHVLWLYLGGWGQRWWGIVCPRLQCILGLVQGRRSWCSPR